MNGARERKERDARRKRERDEPEVDVLSVGDTTLNSSRPVGNSAEHRNEKAGELRVSRSREERSSYSRHLSSLSLAEHIVVSASRDLGSSETRSDLETLGGRDGEHGVGESSLELVEAGLSKLNERRDAKCELERLNFSPTLRREIETYTSRDVPDDTGDSSSKRVVGGLGLSDFLAREERKKRSASRARAHALPPAFLLPPPSSLSRRETYYSHPPSSGQSPYSGIEPSPCPRSPW